MAKVHFDVSIGKNRIPNIKSDVNKAVGNALKTIALDLARTASETAPHLTGDLEDSYAIEYSLSGDNMYATVEFSVYKGNFNYAIAMHEWTYKLGEGSKAKGGGTGMSGTTYAVGNKFLTKVLDGESEAYSEYIARKINEIIGR